MRAACKLFAKFIALQWAQDQTSAQTMDFPRVAIDRIQMLTMVIFNSYGSVLVACTGSSFLSINRKRNVVHVGLSLVFKVGRNEQLRYMVFLFLFHSPGSTVIVF